MFHTSRDWIGKGFLIGDTAARFPLRSHKGYVNQTTQRDEVKRNPGNYTRIPLRLHPAYMGCDSGAGVYVEEIGSAVHAIQGVSTDIAGFVGFTQRGPYRPKLVTSLAQFERIFGAPASPIQGFLPYAVRGFFENGGRKAYIARVGRDAKTPITASEFIGNPKAKPSRRRGLAALADIAEISILALPDVAHPRVRTKSRGSILRAAVAQCEARRDRVVFIDAPAGARDLGRSDPIISNIQSSYAAAYGPWLEVPTGKRGPAISLPPSGYVAGIYARNDNERGVWKAPAALKRRCAASSV
jgi:phage tail sheath protein FI